MSVTTFRNGARVVEFKVIGDPKPQGSKAAFVAKNGKAQMKESSGAGHAVWRDAVAVAAKAERDWTDSPLDGPLELDVVFRFKMPASRSKADRQKGSILKVSAPDTSKLVRAVEDALQAAGLITDDARIAELSASKWEVHDEWTGALISVREALSFGHETTP